MRRGDTLTLSVEALAFGGDSLAHAPDGRVVFFAGGAPGDRVRVQVEEVKPRFARAVIVELVEAGAARVPTRCPLVGTCGGCQWQEASLEVQRSAKRAIVERALGRLGAEVAPLVAASPPFAYRSRARMTVGAGGALGFHARRSHDVVDVTTCPLLEPALDAALQLARRHLADHLPAEAAVSGLVGRGGKVQLAVERVVARGQVREAVRALAEEAGIAGVVCGGEVFGAAVIEMPGDEDGRGRGDERGHGHGHGHGHGEEGRLFWGAADGFAQASHEGNRVLRGVVAAEARRLLDGVIAPRVLELYAGDGNFTRDLARLSTEVWAVEAERGACERLVANVAGPTRPRVIALPAGEAVRRLESAGERFDLVVLDPPRTGAAEVVGRLPGLAPCVLYVSCDPMTLARDAAVLTAAGLAPERATPVDLMPQTSHVETVCTLRRRA